MTIFCSKCGTPNEDDALFCKKCGYQFPKQQTQIGLPQQAQIIIGEKEQTITRQRREEYLIFGVASLLLGIISIVIGTAFNRYESLVYSDIEALMVLGGISIGIGIIFIGVGASLGKDCWVIK